MTFSYGSGSADRYLWLTDPDPTPDSAPDPAIFVSDLQEKKFFLLSFLAWYFLRLRLHHSLKIKSN